MENRPPTASPEKFTAMEVKNRVLQVNEKLKFPFKLTVGESSPLGMLLSLDDTQESNESDFMLGVKEGHYRAGDIGKVIFEDTGGRKYRDIDIKGSGLLSGGEMFEDESGQLTPVQWRTGFYENVPDVRGLMDREDAEHDAIWSEKFTEWGIRTHRCVAIIELQELNEGGKLLPVDEFKKRVANPEHFESVLPKDFTPVIEVRAYGIKTRVSEMFGFYPSQKFDAAFIESASTEIRDAIGLIAEETGQDRNMSIKEYMDWFAHSLGESVGIMHFHKVVHKNIHTQNITLDARIVDLDDVATEQEIGKTEDFSKLIQNDITRKDDKSVLPGALDSLKMFVGKMKDIFPEESENISEEDVERNFMEAYMKNNPEYKNFKRVTL